MNALKSESNAHLTFLNGTHPYKPSEKIEIGNGTLNPIESQRVWFYVNDDASEYANIDESISHVVSYANLHGPFDGIVGFSQGAALASVVIKTFPHLFKYAILISGFKPRAVELADLYSENTPCDVASFHTYGLNDTYCSPERSLAFAKCFTDSVVVAHGAGHFAPDAWPIADICKFVAAQAEKNQSPTQFYSTSVLASKIEQLNNQLIRFEIDKINLEALINTLNVRDLFNSEACKQFFEDECEKAYKNLDQTLKSINIGTNSIILYDILFLIYTLLVRASDFEEKNKQKIDFTSLPLEKLHSYAVVRLFFSVYLSNSSEFKSHFLTKSIKNVFIDTNYWKFLIYLCDLSYMVSENSDNYEILNDKATQKAESRFLYEFLIDTFFKQLLADLKQLDSKNKSNLTQELTWLHSNEFTNPGDVGSLLLSENRQGMLSDLAKRLPRVRSSIDKRSRVARECARKLNPYQEGSETAKIVSYNHYRKCLSAICFYNDQRVKSLQTDNNPRVQMYAARHDKATMERLASAPLSDAIVNPVPEPVDISSHEQMRPLYEWLERNRLAKLNELDLQFLRGTVTTDGRLDLCKQVIGPQGVKPLLDAMQDNSQIDRILLGNNIIGDEAGRVISDFIKVKALFKLIFKNNECQVHVGSKFNLYSKIIFNHSGPTLNQYILGV
jgi:predicted esterase